MARSEYKTIIAAKPVVTRIEQYRKQKSLLSNSQALAALTEEVDHQSKLMTILLEFLKKIKQTMQDFKGKSGNQYQKVIQSLMELVTSIIEAMTNPSPLKKRTS